MQGVLVLKTMADAEAKGFQFFDRSKDGYFIVRKFTSRGWALAIVEGAEQKLPR
ncbi:MAG: hypothetical protein M3Z41_04815 [Candidatus Eremiobacteraeota bacterium]|nr:hypothetical protein [Candidatus Eremiobacteraeota bacterium]